MKRGSSAMASSSITPWSTAGAVARRFIAIAVGPAGDIQSQCRRLVAEAGPRPRAGAESLRGLGAAGRAVAARFGAQRDPTAHEANLLEEAGRELKTQNETLHFDLHPYEIKTIRLRAERTVMGHYHSRRDFLKTSSLAIVGESLPRSSCCTKRRSSGWSCWDEQQPAQKQAYPNFLGNEIAAYLRTQAGISVRSVSLDDPGQGLGDDGLDECDVLIWWGHVRNGEVTPEVGQAIVRRIKAGTLSLIALYSAHWSTPFVEAMYERTPGSGRATSYRGKYRVRKSLTCRRRTIYRSRGRCAASALMFRGASFRTIVSRRPFNCRTVVFRRIVATANRVKCGCSVPTIRSSAGIPVEFEIPQTEMYGEPFHVPEPDEVIFEERWATGEWFRSGAIWRIGRRTGILLPPRSRNISGVQASDTAHES